jgi:hypothetical protein
MVDGGGGGEHHSVLRVNEPKKRVRTKQGRVASPKFTRLRITLHL